MFMIRRFAQNLFLLSTPPRGKKKFLFATEYDNEVETSNYHPISVNVRAPMRARWGDSARFPPWRSTTISGTTRRSLSTTTLPLAMKRQTLY